MARGGNERSIESMAGNYSPFYHRVPAAAEPAHAAAGA
jgi:hypothetical protein